jgi:hypothetical protein
MASGVITNLAATPAGYKAAWLIDQFALGIGNDGIPAGWEGGAVTDEEKRNALSFAIFEVGMSPSSDPLSLSGGSVFVWYGPSLAISLGQAYLDALAGTTIDQGALEAKYDIIIGDQWVNGSGYAHWVCKVEQPELTRIDVVPDQVTMHVGGTQPFSAQGVDQKGNAMGITPTWSSIDGNISGNGAYTPSALGLHHVIAGAIGSSLTGTGTVSATAIPITNVVIDAHCTVLFPGYTTTVYTLQHRTSLTEGDWENVAGAGPERGAFGLTSLTDTNSSAAPAQFYRLNYVVTP